MTFERTYDVAIVGQGATGRAAALELSRRGVDVIGLDRFTPPHTFGSSHGYLADHPRGLLRCEAVTDRTSAVRLENAERTE